MSTAHDAGLRPEGLPRQARIRKRPHFLSVQARGARAHGKYLIAIAARGTSGQVRLGVTASKKVGKAVVRNRAKRLVRESFRRLRAGLPPGIDVVVITRPSIAGLGLAAVVADLEQTLQRVLRGLSRGDGGRRGRRRKQHGGSRRTTSS